MGHDPAGEAMRDWYDNPQATDILMEQEAIFPNGILATLKPAKMVILDEFTGEELDLLRSLKAKDIDSFDFMSKWKVLHPTRTAMDIRQVVDP